MLRSMTGYGDATVERADFALAIELRSFNNRFLKLSSKIPEEVGYLQTDLEGAVRKRLLRGSVFFSVRFEPRRLADLYEVNADVVRKYVASIRELGAALGASREVRLEQVLLLPGAIRTEEGLVIGKDQVLPSALAAMDVALEKVIAMRDAEGRNLTNELRQRHGVLRGWLETIKQEAPRALEEHFRKVEEKMNKLLGQERAAFSPQDVLREAAILAERSDIAEEIARLESHLEQFVETLDQEGPVGRKLEFIVQEMLRESNTMGAKVASGDLSRHVVEVKSEIDRLKEQVLNIE